MFKRAVVTAAFAIRLTDDASAAGLRNPNHGENTNNQVVAAMPSLNVAMDTSSLGERAIVESSPFSITYPEVSKENMVVDKNEGMRKLLNEKESDEEVAQNKKKEKKDKKDKKKKKVNSKRRLSKKKLKSPHRQIGPETA